MTNEPDPVHAAVLAELGGADSITVHLREDRRHIQDRDVRILKETLRVPMNLEMAVTPEMTKFALDVVPAQATLVPEKREELTTEGGLDVIAQLDRVERCIRELQGRGIHVSLFIDPNVMHVETARDLGANAIELHTGSFADAGSPEAAEEEFHKLVEAGRFAVEHGLQLNMGHGLTYRNVRRVAAIPSVHELNIGHSVVSHAVMVGFERAVREMKDLLV